MEIDESSATVALAAKALGCEEGRIAKTISFFARRRADTHRHGGRHEDRQRKIQIALRQEGAKMLSHEEAAQLIGHAVGGVARLP